VVTISILVLLALVCVGLLSLSTTTVRTARHAQAMELARTNARLALMVAIGELQQHAGSDTAITTDGRFVPVDPESSGPSTYGRRTDEVANPWLTGVWRRLPREQAPLDPNLDDYQPHPVAPEVAWLVSGNEALEPGAGDQVTPETSIPSPDSDPEQSVWMLRRALEAGDLDGDEIDRLSVKVPLVSTESGAYGYWVADQSLKASLGLPTYPSEDFAGYPDAPDDEDLARLARSPHGIDPTTLDALAALADPEDPAWRRVLSYPSTFGAAPDTPSEELRAALARHFHDLGAASNTLQTDAKLGGLKRDLSLAFEMEDEDFNLDRFFTRTDQETGSGADDEGRELDDYPYENRGMKRWNGGPLWNEGFTHEFVFFEDHDEEARFFLAPDGAAGEFVKLPTWHLLRDFYRSYREIEDPDGSPTLLARPTSLQAPDTHDPVAAAKQYAQAATGYLHHERYGQERWKNKDRDFDGRTRWRTSQRRGGGKRLTMPTRHGFHPVLARLQLGFSLIKANAFGPGGRSVKLKLVIDPVVTLWNPHNVRLRVNKFTIAHLPDIHFIVEKQEPWQPGRVYAPEEEVFHEDRIFIARGAAPGINRNRQPDESPQFWRPAPPTAKGRTRQWSLASHISSDLLTQNYRSGTHTGENQRIDTSGLLFVPARGGAFELEPGELAVFSSANSTPEDFQPIANNKVHHLLLERGWNEDGGIAFDRLRVDLENRAPPWNWQTRGPSTPEEDRYWFHTWIPRPFRDSPEARVWTDPGARARLTVEPYRNGSYKQDDPFGFIDRYPFGGWVKRTGKGGYPSSMPSAPQPGHDDIGQLDNLTGNIWWGDLTEHLATGDSPERPTGMVRFGHGTHCSYRERQAIGSYGDDLPAPGMSDVFAVNSLGTTRKRWVGQFDFALRTEADVDRSPIRIGQFNPRYQINVSGIERKHTPHGRNSCLPYELRVARLTSATGMTEMTPEFRGFWGPSNTAAGETSVPMFEVPTAPMTSLAQFQHLRVSPWDNDPAYIIGNSQLRPDLEPDLASRSGERERTQIDYSWYLNQALFDSFFFSSLRPDDLAPIVEDGLPPRNPRLAFIRPTGETDETLLERLGDPARRPHEQIAANLWVRGGFNVNSTSVAAWKAFLAGSVGGEILIHDDEGGLRLEKPRSMVISRFSMPNGDTGDPWRGYRELDDDELTRLAEALVEQVRARGPFLTLADFVNRRLEPTAGGDFEPGALQAAIDEAELNQDFDTRFDAGALAARASAEGYRNGSDITNFREPEHAAGACADGAATFIQQADLLQAIAPALSVRGDTFLVRGYGEARDAEGEVLARAWCEARVQRTPRFVRHRSDPSASDGDLPWTRPDELESDINRLFGRRFAITSFRWLDEQEV